MTNGIHILFLSMYDGAEIASRTWNAVPQSGDQIILDLGGPKPLYRVACVRWRENASQMPERYDPTPFVEVYLER
jgi:hypothetical protein